MKNLIFILLLIGMLQSCGETNTDASNSDSKRAMSLEEEQSLKPVSNITFGGEGSSL